MHQLRPGRPTLEESAALPRKEVWLVLENIRSALNVGSLFRTADAFRLGGICLCGYSAGPDHKEVRKSALGAEDSVPHRLFPNGQDCIQALKQEGFRILALEQTTGSTPLESYERPEGPVALILGNEVDGVSPQSLALCDAALEIGQGGIKHSLNVAVAGGIAAWWLAGQG